MRIAVIGTGISGLSAAWLLHRHAEVSVYEQNGYAGGHTNTVEVPEAPGTLPVDTGFIVFNERNYPNLTRLFRLLGVKSHPSDMSFAASIDDGRVEWAGDNLNTLFAQRRNLLSAAHWRMLRDILRFNRDGKRVLLENLSPDITLGEFLDRHGYSDELCYRYLLPMAAAIWSCPMNTMLDFPAWSFLHFCNNHCLLNLVNRPQWRTVTGGGREYVRKLMQPLGGHLHLNSAVVQVKRTSRGVCVKDRGGHEAHYDRVVMAAHADQSLAMLADASETERTVLGAFKYQDNRAILHTDKTLMPKLRKVWASWNYLADDSQDDSARVSVSYWMNRLQKLATTKDYFLTLNPLHEPVAESVVYETHYEHPVFSREALWAQEKLDLIQGVNQTWFCGAWCGYGFHEDGLKSAMRVVQHMGHAIPWMMPALTDPTTAPRRQSGWAQPALEDA